MATSKTKMIEHNRSAVTGEYVTEKYAKRHPRKTVKETDKVAVKNKSKK